MIDILNVLIDEERTIRDYLFELLSALWEEGDGFKGKRPLGDSDWQWIVYIALVKNGFIYSLKQPKGMFSYHYVIVNEPSHKSNKRSLKEILENHTLFSGDGESQMKNQEPNNKAEKKDTNIALTNKDLKNKDASNKDVFNSTLGIKENPTKTEELTKFWYENIDNTKLSDSEEKEFLTQELFVSVLAQTVSKIKINKSQFEEHPLNIPLKSFYYVFGFTVRDWKYTEKPYTFSNISDEAISFIQKSKKYPNV
jgi:hypothetical protein